LKECNIKIYQTDCVIVGQSDDKYFANYHAANLFIDDLTAFLKLTIQDGWRCIDVGANIGLTSIFMTKCAPNVEVIAFEPAPKCIPFLTQNVWANGEGMIKVAPVGLGGKSGLVPFVELPNFSAGSHIGGNKASHPAAVKGKKVWIKIDTLDNYCRTEKIERIDLIKIDAEGYEINVLTGARDTLRKFKPVVILEFNSWFMTQVQEIDPAAVLAELFAIFDSIGVIHAGNGSEEAIENSAAGHMNFINKNQERGCVDNLVCRIS
jgi:FkbM family methyltransferase